MQGLGPNFLHVHSILYTSGARVQASNMQTGTRSKPSPPIDLILQLLGSRAAIHHQAVCTAHYHINFCEFSNIHAEIVCNQTQDSFRSNQI